MLLSSSHPAPSFAKAIGGVMLLLLLSSTFAYLIVNSPVKLPISSGIETRARPEMMRPAHWHTPALPMAR